MISSDTLLSITFFPQPPIRPCHYARLASCFSYPQAVSTSTAWNLIHYSIYNAIAFTLGIRSAASNTSSSDNQYWRRW